MAAGKNSEVLAANQTTGTGAPSWDTTYLISDVDSFDHSIDVTQLETTALGDDWKQYEEGLKDFSANISIRSLPNVTLVDDTVKGLKGLINYCANNTGKELWIKFQLTDFFYITAKMVLATWNPSTEVDGQSGMTFSLQNSDVAPTISLS